MTEQNPGADPGTEQRTTDQCEDQLGVHAEDAPMLMAVAFVPRLVVGAFKQTFHNSYLLGYRY